MSENNNHTSIKYCVYILQLITLFLTFQILQTNPRMAEKVDKHEIAQSEKYGDLEIVKGKRNVVRSRKCSASMQSQRHDHLTSLISELRQRDFNGNGLLETGAGVDTILEEPDVTDESVEGNSNSLNKASIKNYISNNASTIIEQASERLVEVRLKNVSYHVPIRTDVPSITTVRNQSVCYWFYSFLVRLSSIIAHNNDAEEGVTTTAIASYKLKQVLQDRNLVLHPGKTYIVLDPPECGKTSLLKLIAGRLVSSKNYVANNEKNATTRKQITGNIEFNGLTIKV